MSAKTKYTKQDCIDAVRKFAEEDPNPRRLSYEAWRKHQIIEYPCYETINKHFGSWNKCKIEAGLAVNSKFPDKKQYSNKTIFQSLRRIEENLYGKFPTISEYESYYDEEIDPTSHLIRKRFGSWTKAFEFYCRFKYENSKTIWDFT